MSSIPRKPGRRHAKRGAVFAGVAVGLLTFTTIAGITTANSAAPALAPAVVPAALTPINLSTNGGWLVIDTSNSGSGQVTYDKNRDGVADVAAQPLIGDSRTCLLSQANTSLMSFSGFVGTTPANVASFQSGSLGVAEKKTGTSCYQVNSPLERLDVKISNPKQAMSSALLDVELKQGARILATATFKGQTVGYFEMRSGGSIGTTVPLPNNVTATAVYNCQTSADSGPDAGANDNCRWPVSKPSWLGDDSIYFDSLSLQALAGSFTLEGGSDGAITTGSLPPSGFPQRATFFEVADGILNCGESTQTLPLEFNAPQVTVRRLDNADATGCRPVPYTLTHDALSTTFLKPLDQQTTAQFVLDIVWKLPIDPLGTATTSATRMNYQSSPTSLDIPLNWCPNPIFSGSTLMGIESPLAQPDQDGLLNGVQFSCVGTSYSTVVNPPTGDDYLQITEQVYLEGDAYASRGG